jgi:superfamily I DNA and/or RNA helicase
VLGDDPLCRANAGGERWICARAEPYDVVVLDEAGMVRLPSVFAAAGMVTADGRLVGDERLVALREQYRMRPGICDLHIREQPLGPD